MHQPFRCRTQKLPALICELAIKACSREGEIQVDLVNRSLPLT